MAGFSDRRGAVAASQAAAPQIKLERLAFRAVLSFGLAALFLFLLQSRLASIDLDAVAHSLHTVSAAQWGLATLATAISFWAVGQYDAALHRHYGTGVSPNVASRAGVAAIAVSQTLGLGVVTGAILRWRMLPGIDLWAATRMTVAVTVSFLAGWAAVTAMTLLILPQAPFKSLSLIVLIFVLGLTALCLAAPTLTLRSRPIRLPNAFTLSRVLILTAVDTGAAALALFALCPPDLVMPFTTLLPAFLIALGAGLVSGAPGGVGAFEVTLLALLPMAPEAPLLAAILAYRAIYYAIPAVAGAGLTAWGPRETEQNRRTVWPADPDLATLAPRAESLLIRQGELTLLPAGNGAWVAGRTAHGLVALFDPLQAEGRAARSNALSALLRAAKSEGRLPCLYKCSARTAAIARQAGFHVVPIASEAYLDPRGFSLATPARASLRRKLRRAEAAGVTISTGTQPLAAMARLAQEWAATHGGERGFSIGRFCPRYVAGQRTYLAWQGPDLVAFVSFHEGVQEWTLDLMRHSAAVPDGTMHALIAQAIADASRHGLPRLSLAAVPIAAKRPAAKGTRLPQWFRKFGPATRAANNGAGLARFKDSFAPAWQPLYIAAPTRRSLALCAAEIARAILRPATLSAQPAPNSDRFHNHNEDYEIASDPGPWQRKKN